MTKQDTLNRIQSEKIIGIVRLGAGSDLRRVVEALSKGGIHCVEITMTTPGVLAGIESSSDLPDVLIGAGTVLDGRMAKQAIGAGARFLVTPTVELDVVDVAHQHDVVAVIGAFTPTEILSGWRAGADLIKFFPASIGGPGMLRAIRGPLPHIPLVATGGVSAENCVEFLRSGACAVCMGGWLVPQDVVDNGRYDVLTERARQVVNRVRNMEGEDGHE